MGNPHKFARWSHRARIFLCAWRGDGAVARLHQKDAEDPAKGIGYRATAHERFEMSDSEQDIESGTMGQSFDDFLRDEGTYEETTERAVKRVIAFQLAEAMKAKGLSKVQMAERLDTSRSQLDRLLDPDNDSVTLAVLTRAARAVGRDIRLELI